VHMLLFFANLAY